MPADAARMCGSEQTRGPHQLIFTLLAAFAGEGEVLMLAAIQRFGQSVFQVSLGAGGEMLLRTSHATPEAAPPRSVKWRLLAEQERAMPGFMTLRVVRDGAHVADFVWEFASAAAVRLLCHTNAADLVGKRLLKVLCDHPGRSAVFEQYRRAVEHGSAEAFKQVHVVNGVEDIYRHGAVRMGDGVAVTLTNLSAVRRMQALQLELNVHHSMVRKRV